RDCRRQAPRESHGVWAQERMGTRRASAGLPPVRKEVRANDTSKQTDRPREVGSRVRLREESALLRSFSPDRSRQYCSPGLTRTPVESLPRNYLSTTGLLSVPRHPSGCETVGMAMHITGDTAA